METEQAIRSRRTHKAFGPEPLSRETLDELVELARWAPNHRLSNPWRMRVVGPKALERLKRAAGGDQERKLDRAPTLLLVSAALTGDPVADEEDVQSAAVAAYIVLLAAHARGLAGYWRTPAVLRTQEGRAALSIPESERVIGLLYLGRPRQERPAPEREAPGEYVTYLD